jgi:hypothetical protein
MPATQEQIDALVVKVAAHPDFPGAVAALILRYAALTGPKNLRYGPAGVSEDDTNGTVVSSVDGVDDGVPPLVYSLTDDAGGRFAVDSGTGQITVADASSIVFATATAHDITVQVADSNNSTATVVLNIPVTEGAGAPDITISLSANRVIQGSANGTAIGTATQTGAESGTWSLQSNPVGLAAIHSTTGALTLADTTLLDGLDTNESEAFSITIRFTDNGNTQDLPVDIVGVAADYDPLAFQFQSPDDYGTGGALSGAVDSDELTIAGWVKRDTADAMSVLHFVGSVAGHSLRYLGTNQLRFFLSDAAGNTLVNVSTDPMTDTDPHYIFFSCRDGATKKDIIFRLDGVSSLVNETTNVNGDIAMSSVTTSYIGAAPGDTDPILHFNGGLAEIMLWQEYFENEALLRDAQGKLINPGPTGSLVTGTAPLFMIGGPDASLANPLNDLSGNGNHFTPTGTIGEFTPGPNDDVPEDPPDGQEVFASAITVSALNAAYNQVTEHDATIWLPEGTGSSWSGWTQPAGGFRVHIRGAAFQPATNGYLTATTDPQAQAALANYQPATKIRTVGLGGGGVTVITLNVPGSTVSHIYFEARTTADDTGIQVNTQDDTVIYYCRFDNFDAEAVNFAGTPGNALLTHCAVFTTGDGEGFHCTRGNSSSTYAAYDLDALAGSFDQPYVQYCLFYDAGHWFDWSRNGVGVLRYCRGFGGQGSFAQARFHGRYLFNGAEQTSGRWAEIYGNYCRNSATRSAWTFIHMAGGDGVAFDNTVLDFSRFAVFNLEATSRQGADPNNPSCAEQSYPEPQQTRVFHLWGNTLDGAAINDIGDLHFNQCSEPGFLFNGAGEEIFFVQRPDYTAAGAHANMPAELA